MKSSPMTSWTASALLICCAQANTAKARATQETFGCEANPTANPIGGGKGYKPTFTGGELIARTADELVAALGEATARQRIFVPDGTEIDLTGRKDIEIPGGVTLADTRGVDGSLGARISTTWRASHRFMKTAGHHVRLTGLRFEGAYGGTKRDEMPRPAVPAPHAVPVAEARLVRQTSWSAASGFRLAICGRRGRLPHLGYAFHNTSSVLSLTVPSGARPARPAHVARRSLGARGQPPARRTAARLGFRNRYYVPPELGPYPPGRAGIPLADAKVGTGRKSG